MNKAFATQVKPNGRAARRSGRYHGRIAQREGGSILRLRSEDGSIVTVEVLGIEQARPAGRLVPTEKPKPMTGAEALAYWKQNGLLGAFTDRPEDSPELARELRRQAEDRQWDEA